MRHGSDLLAAALDGDVARVEALLNANPDCINERGTLPGHIGARTALHFAVNGPHEEVIALLLARGADPNILCEGDSATALHFAAERGHLGIVRQLIEHGTDPIGHGDYHELDVIGWATVFGPGDPVLVGYLLAHGARHTIFSAVAVGDLSAIGALLAETPALIERPMVRPHAGRRPLHLSAVKRQPGALAALLERGANLETLDLAGFTPLDQAAMMGERAMAQTLLDRGAALRLPAAIGLGIDHDIERLIASEPGCLTPGQRWGTLIVRAAERAPGHVIERLIVLGASPNIIDDPNTAIDSTEGYTPLHAAGFHGNVEAAMALLRHGADRSVEDGRYKGTPAGWANYAGHAELARMLDPGGPTPG
jgi:ankyrin repeat protein